MTGKILVVDDVLPNVKLLQVKLTNEYFDVVTAMSGPEALRMVQEERPDIVLLDVMMPGMDGYEVCQILKQDPATRDIPVVMVTALSDRADRVRGLESGADDFLSKPINDIALFARVRSLLRLKSTADQFRLRHSTSSALGMLGEPDVDSLPYDEARIMCVTDDMVMSRRLIDVLEGDRHSVDIVGSPDDFDRRLDTYANGVEELPALIIVSLSLRSADGLRIVSLLRAQQETRNVPILTLVDEGDNAALAKGLELGANDYVPSPIDEHELLLRTRNQIRRKRFNDRMMDDFEASISAALTDQLTGLYNRRYALAHLGNAMTQWKNEQKPFSVMLFDIDFFKRINDTHGHDVGDAVLIEFANRLLASVRTVDLLARFGGEEFILILPDTELEIAAMIGERLRESIEYPDFVLGPDIPPFTVTTSAGVAQIAPGDENAEAAVKRADQGLYAAKHGGRNKIAVAKADGETELLNAENLSNMPFEAVSYG